MTDAQRRAEKAAHQRAYRARNLEKVRARKRELYLLNREKVRAQIRAWAEANPEKIAAKRRAYWEANRERLRAWGRAWKYGISVAELQKLLARGACDICGSTERLHVDHCHRAGAVRGLLCRSCNLGLGNFRDDAKLLRAATTYLKKHHRRNHGS